MSQPDQLKIQVEIEDDDKMAAINLSEGLLAELNQQSGYTARPTRGPILDVIVQLAQNAHNNQDLLKVLFSAATPVVTYLLGKQKTKTPDKKLKVTIEVDGKPVTVEADDAENVEQLVARFQATHPEETKKLTPKSKVKVKASRP